MSCALSGVILSPTSTLFSSRLVILSIHSIRGSGPGALPPDVTNGAPFGLISEQSNDIFSPSIMDFTQSLTASAQPSLLSSTMMTFASLPLSGNLVGSFDTFAFCTEYPTPVPPSSRNIASEKAVKESIGRNAQLYILLWDFSIATPPNCIDRIDGRIALSSTAWKASSIVFLKSSLLSQRCWNFRTCISLFLWTISAQVSRLSKLGMYLAYFPKTVMSLTISLSKSILSLSPFRCMPERVS